MSNLRARAHDLNSSLAEFSATDIPGRPIGDMYDAVLKAAQAELPEDAIISGLETGRRSSIGRPVDSAGDMRAVLQQIITALDQKTGG